MNTQRPLGLYWGSVKTAALMLSLVGSAYLMALAVASPAYPGLGLLTLLPLFLAIRVCRPTGAGLGGALWGLSLYAFSVTGSGHSIDASVSSLALLTAIPGLYTYFSARLTRWTGFNPFVLGVSWMGVELALEPLGLRSGLLAGTQGDGALMHWIGGALGYVLVAFLVAFVSAAIVSVLSRAYVGATAPRYLVGSGDNDFRIVQQTFSCFPLFVIPPSRPRAPPMPLLAG
ncbi:MAG: hypothetical protein JSU86_15320 [Phycisphaerales bacterium]|nr:MAG: hypothetical protein JSU86_15320 [Phycisphaerales bacterium]